MKTKDLLLIGVVLIPMMMSAQNNYWFKKGRDSKDPKKQIEYFTKSIEKEGATAKAYNSRGTAKDKLKDYQGAVADYSKAIEIDAKFADAYNNRGSVRKNLQDYQGAIVDLNEYISLEPNNPYGYNSRGFFYLILAEYAQAIADLNKASSIKSDYASAYANLGYVYMQQGKTEMAIENFNKCLKIDRKSISANLDFAIISYLKSNLQESKKYLRFAKSIDPRLSKGIDGINELEKENYYWTDKDKETLKKMFVELK
jgi:tetratricopeptide (TPR) repeat protein